MQTQERINILCTPDDNYIPYCGIMLTSLFENNKQEDIAVYIICDTLCENNRVTMLKLGKEYGRQINIIKTTPESFVDCPIRDGDHVSIAAYYRLIAPLLLPKNLDKVLYLDCDIIINGNIRELYDTNITEKAFGAIIDEAYFINEKYERLQIPNNQSYINSGVILFNLKYWRENDTCNKCMNYILCNREKIVLHDQDTLNAVLYDKIKSLPIKYNFQTGFMFTHFKYEERFFTEIKDVMFNPVIIHYTGNNKPWNEGCKHPYVKRFLYYKRISIWARHPFNKNKIAFTKKLKNLVYKALCILNLKQEPKMFILNEQN